MARAIDADALLELLKDPERYGYLDTIDIINAPTIDPVKHGKWMPESDDDQDEGCYYCSECKSAEFFPEGIPFSRFCSNCGARMDGE